MAKTAAKPEPKAAPKIMNKSDMVKALAESAGTDKKIVNAVLDGLSSLAADALKKGGPGVFKIHGLVQLKRVDVPAKPARRGIDPFTKLERDFPAKPASSKVKAGALKAAKDAVV